VITFGRTAAQVITEQNTSSCGSTKANWKLSADPCGKPMSSQKKCLVLGCRAKAQLARDSGFQASGRVSWWVTPATCTC